MDAAKVRELKRQIKGVEKSIQEYGSMLFTSNSLEGIQSLKRSIRRARSKEKSLRTRLGKELQEKLF